MNKGAIHSPHQTQLGKKKPLSTHPQEKKGKPLHFIMCLLIGCMEILFIKLATIIFGLGLIALLKTP
jgi:hypothetical protein